MLQSLNRTRRVILTLSIMIGASLALTACCPCWGWDRGGHDRYYDSGPPRGYYR